MTTVLIILGAYLAACVLLAFWFSGLKRREKELEQAEREFAFTDVGLTEDWPWPPPQVEAAQTDRRAA